MFTFQEQRFKLSYLLENFLFNTKIEKQPDELPVGFEAGNVLNLQPIAQFA